MSQDLSMKTNTIMDNLVGSFYNPAWNK